MPVPVEEQIEILVLLCVDKDETTRNTAFYTLQRWNIHDLQQVLSNPSTPFEVLDFAANHLAPGDAEVRESLLKNPNLPDDLRKWVRNLPVDHPGEACLPAAPVPVATSKEKALGDGARETLLQRIGRMSAPEKMKLALVGTHEERLILIRDPNKTVASAVLQSPKLSDQEIEIFASMKNVNEELLRLIAGNRKFMKNYQVTRGLVNNSRTPIDISLPLVNRLYDRDLKDLAVNKNVPDVLRTMAIKAIKQRQEALKVKIPTRKF